MEIPAQRTGSAHQHSPAQAYQPATPLTYPQGTQPGGDQTSITRPVASSASDGAAAPAPANEVTSGASPIQSGGAGDYGPFHGGADQVGGSYGPPISGTDPVYGDPSANPAAVGDPAYSAAPTSGADPGQTYGAMPTAGATPTSGADPAYGAAPISGAGPSPTYGAMPTSGAGPTPAYGTTPTSGGPGPTSSPPSWSATDATSGPTPDSYGFSVSPSYNPGPRIEPTPKQPKSRLLLPALAGLLTGLVIFGTGGWFLGRSTADPATPAPTQSTSAPIDPKATLPPYEQNQVTINQPKFTGPLAPVARGWLPHLSGCQRNGEKDGPVLNKGEKTRVRCEMDAMSVIFVEYATIADRDKARVKTLGQNVDARTLTPGAAGAAVERATPSGRSNGNYVEYAYQASGKTVAGIWWDDSATPVAAYLLAYWKEGTGEKWEPMRDVWARYA
jgi:hypothetical protein